MKKLLCEVHRVGNESYWFCMECLGDDKDMDDPVWLEMSETGVSDSFFGLNLDQTLQHLYEAHGYSTDNVDIGDTAIFTL